MEGHGGGSGGVYQASCTWSRVDLYTLVPAVGLREYFLQPVSHFLRPVNKASCINIWVTMECSLSCLLLENSKTHKQEKVRETLIPTALELRRIKQLEAVIWGESAYRWWPDVLIPGKMGFNLAWHRNPRGPVWWLRKRKISLCCHGSQREWVLSILIQYYKWCRLRDGAQLTAEIKGQTGGGWMLYLGFCFIRKQRTMGILEGQWLGTKYEWGYNSLVGST